MSSSAQGLVASTTKIEWCTDTWNPLRGCYRVSAGCQNCYAERIAGRFWGPGQPFEGLTVATTKGARWTGEVRFAAHKLPEPLRLRSPRRIFVGSMSDLFHPEVPNWYIAAVFGVMAACPRHTFLVLTKRHERAVSWFGLLDAKASSDVGGHWDVCHLEALQMDDGRETIHQLSNEADGRPWPLPNVHFGVSVENQEMANERLPKLMLVPAAIRWLSCEPLLGPIDLRPWLAGVDWVVVGGESGPDARPCAVRWVRSVIDQCREANVPVFCKQLGSDVFGAFIVDKKGADPAEWPSDLRIRQFP